MQNVHRGVRCGARSALLLEPHIVCVHIVQFGPKKIGYGSVALAIDSDGLTSVVLKKDGPMMTPAQKPRQTVTFCGCIVIW